MALQRDGKIVTAGDAVVRGVVRFALARYRTDGTLDPSFGGNGKVTTRIGPSVDVATSVAIQRDGRIVAAGASSTGTGYDFALARYDSTGRLDPTFGVKGRVTTDFGHGEDVAFDLAILPDGRVVVCGLAATTGNDAFALARYRPDGTLDPTFGRHGKKITTFPDNAEATGLAIQSDGKIVVAGSNGDQEYYSQFALARYRPNGALDLTFGQGGRVLTDLGGFGVASDLALQPDGKLVVAGATRRRFALARYRMDGTLDPTFGRGGKVTTGFDHCQYQCAGSGAGAVLIQADGKIVSGGSAWNGAHYDYGLVRYTHRGVLDGTFGAGGKVRTDFAGSDDSAADLAIQADSRIVAAGSVQVGWTTHFGLARYLAG